MNEQQKDTRPDPAAHNLTLRRSLFVLIVGAVLVAVAIAAGIDVGRSLFGGVTMAVAFSAWFVR